MHTPRSSALLLSGLALLSACKNTPDTQEEPPPPRIGNTVPTEQRRGDEIVVCGQLFHTGTRVVLWSDPGGYDAYQLTPRFRELKEDERPRKRYGTRRKLAEDVARRVAEDGWTLPDLQDTVHLFVLHYDVAYVSRQCFKVLQDLRNLSVHFMLDLDGTIYQTLDLKERAFHATIANNHGIGIEIAHPGAYPRPGQLLSMYPEDDKGRFLQVPKWMKETGIRTPDFVARPARPWIFMGDFNGSRRYMRDYTPEQHRALAHLTATLSKIFPRIPLRYPQDAAGRLVTDALPAAELQAFEGVVGHYHVQKNKQDPGPALDFSVLMERARALREDRAGSGEDQ